MKTATIDEYTPHGTQHFAILITYRGREVFHDVMHASRKEELRGLAYDALKRNKFTHWQRPDTRTKYDVSKGIK